jgi:NADH-quinone oxidoreductase subunit F
MSEKILTRNFHLSNSHTLRVYRETGGYQAVPKAFAMEPSAVTEEVKRSNLRGLGGAGVPTGVKWGFVPKGRTAPVYLVINADEGEPGTFKDRYLLEKDPHALIEGTIIAGYAIGSHSSFVYIRGEYVQSWRIFSHAVREAYAAGLLGKNVLGSGFDFDLVIHRGAGAYICGEETGLISSLEGKKGWPKLKPPFPAIKGAFGSPTIVNNVETIAHVPHIINRGAEWFASLGTKTQGGTRIYSLSGHVVRPGIYETPVSVTLRQLIYEHAGGIPGGRRLKAVVPGGSSAAILTADEIDVVMDVDGLRNAGSMAGSAGVIVMDESVSIPEALMVVARFYAHESCGQCTPCRESTGWIYKMTRRIVEGKGRKQDLDTILDVARRGAGTTICAFYDGAVGPYISYIEKFRSEFEGLTPRHSSTLGAGVAQVPALSSGAGSRAGAPPAPPATH